MTLHWQARIQILPVGSWIVVSKCGEDMENSVSYRALGKNKACHHWRQSQSREILQPAAIPYLHSLGVKSILQDNSTRPHRGGFINDYLENLVEWSGWNGLPAVLTSTPLNTCGIRLVLLFIPEWPTQPYWLTCYKCWLKNGIPSYISVCCTRKSCQAVVALYGPSKCYWSPCLINEWILELPIWLVY